MDKRQFIKSVGLVSGAGLITGFPAVHAVKRYRWKMVTTWPKNFPGLGTGANNFAKMIGEMSEGRLSIKVYGAGELVPALGCFDAVSRGTAEVGHGAAYYWKGKALAAQFFATVPFGLNAQEQNAWLYYGGGQELWDQLYAQFNLKPFPAGNSGVQMGGWYKKEIRSIKDYKGLKKRIPGLGGAVLTRAGATVVTLPGGEIFQALKTGAIDATEWVGPYNDMAFGLHKAAKFYYYPGWHEPAATIECFFNKKAYDALPKDLKHIIKYAARAANDDMLAEFTFRNAVALELLVNKHKVILKKFPDSLLKEFGKLSKDVLNDVASKDKMSAKVYKSFNNFREKAIIWNKISEEAYSLARHLSFGT